MLWKQSNQHSLLLKKPYLLWMPTIWKQFKLPKILPIIKNYNNIFFLISFPFANNKEKAIISANDQNTMAWKDKLSIFGKTAIKETLICILSPFRTLLSNYTNFKKWQKNCSKLGQTNHTNIGRKRIETVSNNHSIKSFYFYFYFV